MTYAQARPTIHTGDVIAQTHKRWWPWKDFKVQVVRLFTRSEYAHVGVIWRASGRVFVIEAVQPRVRIFPLSEIGDFFHIPMNKNLSPVAEDFVMSQVGEPYSELLCVATALKLIGRGDIDFWHCAKLVNETLRENKTDLGNALDPSTVVAQLLSNGKRLRLVENGGVK